MVQDLDRVASGFVVVSLLEVREGCFLPFCHWGGFLLLLVIWVENVVCVEAEGQWGNGFCGGCVCF